MQPAHKATFDWDSPSLTALIRAALEEDVGARDATTAALVAAEVMAQARLVAKQELVLAGMPLFARVFRALDAGVRVEAGYEDGSRVVAGSVVASVAGPARAILTGERTALNFLAHLSGIATLTQKFVAAIAGTRARIRDTRKTTPLLRALEKYAVRMGGGTNHRIGLYDAILIKENHAALGGGVGEAVRRARQSAAATALPIQAEVRNEAELHAALAAGAASLLIDNAAPGAAARLIEQARRTRPACVVELSGGVTLENVRAYAEAGADFIAIGALTHSAPAAGLSLLVDTHSVK